MAGQGRSVPQPQTYEAELLPGLKPFVVEELTRRFGAAVLIERNDDAGLVPFRFNGKVHDLLSLRTVTAVYSLLPLAIPRPKALLGHQFLHNILNAIEKARALHPAGAFRTFKVSAAGSNSSVFRRFIREVTQRTGLVPVIDEADLVIRVRRSLLIAGGWDVLVRLSPRPLATRDWRVCDMQGALNATIAAAMIILTHPSSEDRFFNPLCGSGTLLIERALQGPAQWISGCDNSAEALTCAARNLTAAGVSDRIAMYTMDALFVDLADRSVDVLCADLPWGQLVGNMEQIRTLYPAILREAARISVDGARFVVITHAISQFEKAIQECARLWLVRQAIKVFQGGLHPRIYVLERKGTENA